MATRFVTVDRETPMLLPPDLREWVPADHLVHFMRDAVEQLDLRTARVNERLESYGLKETKLFRPTFRDGKADVLPELEREFGLGMTTPREMARLMALIAEGKAVNRQASDAMLTTLRRQQDRAMIPRRLPFERDRIFVASKTGWDEEKLPDRAGFRGDVRGDAAYVKGPRGRYVIAILTRRVKDKSPGVDSDALVTGARISRIVYDEWAGPRAAKAR